MRSVFLYQNLGWRKCRYWKYGKGRKISRCGIRHCPIWGDSFRWWNFWRVWNGRRREENFRFDKSEGDNGRMTSQIKLFLQLNGTPSTPDSGVSVTERNLVEELMEQWNCPLLLNWPLNLNLTLAVFQTWLSSCPEHWRVIWKSLTHGTFAPFQNGPFWEIIPVFR